MSVLISISPNTEASDVWLATQLLLRPRAWRNSKALQEVSAKLAQYLNVPFVTLTSSGRQAIYLLLRAFGVARGDEVIVQALTCVSVPAAVTWVGAKPIYIDIDDTYNVDTSQLEKVFSERTKAIIVQHSFGIPADIPTVVAWARQKNIRVIEDCAHSLGATYQGRPIGSFGDAAILSFGRDKTISSVFGGAIVTANQKIAGNVRTLTAQLQPAPSWWIAQQLLHPLIMALVKPTYFLGGLGKVILVLSQKVGLISRALRPEERSAQRPMHVDWHYPAALAQLLQAQLSRLDAFTERRRQIAQLYDRELGISFKTTASEPSWLRFPILVTSRQKLLAEAKARNVVLGDWYATPVFPVQHNSFVNYSPGSAPHAEAVAQQIINLPTYPTLTDAEAKRIVDLVRPHVAKTV